MTPKVYTLDSSEEISGSSTSTPLELRLSTQRKAESGSGTFQTLAPVAMAKVRTSKKVAGHKMKVLDAYIRQLQQEASLALIKPSSEEGTLISRWIDMLGSAHENSRPLSILGTWIQSIPARIGSSSMLDLAVEFLIDSHAVYWDDSYSKRRAASVTKSKALKRLQLAVPQDQSRKTYEMVLATKMHYAAETLLGVDTMYHAIHAFGLAELLKAGGVANVDDEHYWNLIDNTYIDDVNEAMLAGRASVYDNDYYLSATHPAALKPNLVQLIPSQRASMSIMHVFVQCPRLNCLVRHAIMHPEDSDALAAAVSLAEYLWQIDLPAHVAELLYTAVTIVNAPPCLEMADLLTETLQFNSVQNMILCTRYWMLQNVLCGLTDTLHRHFPTGVSLSLLPTLETVRQFDFDAGIRLAESLAWADAVSQRLPLVPLRLHTPLQISIGPWYRTIRDVNAFSEVDAMLTVITNPDLTQAVRMKNWLIEVCDRIHEQWAVSTVDENSLCEALDSMAGEKIPDWLPTRVRFEAEDGDMVIKLDYEKSTGNYQNHISLGGNKPISHQPGLRMVDNTATYGHSSTIKEIADDIEGSHASPSLDILATPATATSPPPVAADFLFTSGRNLCSTSGCWPTATAGAPNEIAGLPTYAGASKTFGPCDASSFVK
ncbi:hypothetical protein E8E12_006068 [Didymella heteroderae]|uniref:Uncharacterized protein n=1 Tax=Didymella heteroderae TaxID=1769908 RepID=A0A9P5C0P0_9PLEO|nr:hypothetical protein E8E12_006068 [Didymella heteroderae]